MSIKTTFVQYIETEVEKIIVLNLNVNLNCFLN